VSRRLKKDVCLRIVTDKKVIRAELLGKKPPMSR
jgi:hypothetical protein